MRIALLVAVLAGCGGGPDPLPDHFRIDAEIVDVTGPGADLCAPTPSDVNPNGPDWRLEFMRFNDPSEPTFRDLSLDGDSADKCARSGNADCCRPARAIGDGWVLECDGHGIHIIPQPGDPVNHFVFTFGADGSGTEATTAYSANGLPFCAARATWSAIVPIE